MHAAPTLAPPEAPPPLPEVTAADRLALTFSLALLLHGAVLFGVSFSAHDRLPPEYMDVILVQQASLKPNPDADLLAQANSEGGGDSADDVRPSAPFEAPLPAPTPNVVTAAPSVPPPSPPAPEPEPAETTAEPLVEAPPLPEPEVVEDPAPPPPAQLATEAPAPEQVAVTEPPPTPPPPKVETRPAAKPKARPKEVAVEEQRPKKQPPQPAAPTPAPEAPSAPRPSASTLMADTFAVASLDAEIKQKLEAHAKRPRRKFISANTRDYKYAAYMESWRAKVERVGNLNYPDEAREKGLSGSLILDVAVNPDGSVGEIIVRKSSGHKVLDDAAVRIVELAAPYAPFPRDFVDEVDVLHVTRTWQFLNNYRFSSR
jgi:periplasmic protein TonB